jgi:hypothetical protein
LFGASSNRVPSILTVPLLPGGFGAAGALERPPATTGMRKPAVAATMPVATSTRPRVESTSEDFATTSSPPRAPGRWRSTRTTLGVAAALQVPGRFPVRRVAQRELKKGLAERSPHDGEHPPASVAAVETHD